MSRPRLNPNEPLKMVRISDPVVLRMIEDEQKRISDPNPARTLRSMLERFSALRTVAVAGAVNSGAPAQAATA
jgi:hypothetical protein